jgi:hypothetical protein
LIVAAARETLRVQWNRDEDARAADVGGRGSAEDAFGQRRRKIRPRPILESGDGARHAASVASGRNHEHAHVELVDERRHWIVAGATQETARGERGVASGAPRRRQDVEDCRMARR